MTKTYYTIFLLLIVFLSSCTKENLNERKIAGVWLGTQVQYITYIDNAIVKDSIVPNSGAMYLFDDDEMENQVSHSLAIPPPFSSTWEGSQGEQHTLFGMNIRKHTKNKLELSLSTADDDLNQTSMTVYYFERD